MTRKLPHIRFTTTAYVLALLLLAGLSIGSHLLLNQVVASQARVAEVVNLAGRQRMLSQRLAKLALQWPGETPQRHEHLLNRMQQAASEMAAAHRLLSNANSRLGGQYVPAVAKLYEQGELAINRLVTRYLMDVQLVMRPGPVNRPEVLQDMLRLADSTLLNQLDAVVLEYQHQSESRIQELLRMQNIGLAIMLATLLLEGLFIFRPLFMRLILREKEYRHLLAVMERRIAHRTRELTLAGKVLEQTSEGVLILDKHGKVLQCNPASSRITGRSTEGLVGHMAPLLCSRRHDSAFYRSLWAALEWSGSWEGEIWDTHQSGREFPAWVMINRVAIMGETCHIVLFHDVSANHKRTQSLRHMAFHDALTGLPNRYLLQDKLNELLHQSHGQQQVFSLIYLDLDRFKNINETLGHEAGDILLAAFARRLRSDLPESFILARMGGDEFVILLPDLASQEELMPVIGMVTNVAATPLDINGLPVQVTVSIGVASFPEHGVTASDLLKHADSAMILAKSEGGNLFHFFEPDMSERISRSTRLEMELRTAIEHEELVLYYQPKVRLDTGMMVGVEALLRWPHPQEGLISPDEFIPLAETTGLIVELGDLVLRMACRQLSDWRDLGIELTVAVNVSVKQLLRSTLHLRIDELLHQYQIPAHWLQVEITENNAMLNLEHISQQLQQLRDMGIRVAIDDFGTGHSSLATLKVLPVDYLKIDKSFVLKATVDEEDAMVVKTIIGLGHLMHKQVVAEGVETREHVELLQTLGCEQGQGYYFAKPVPSELIVGMWNRTVDAGHQPGCLPMNELQSVVSPR